MITLRQVTLRRGVKVVLEGAQLTLNPGEKVGLVGRNGAGKSSLFALLTDRLHADAGDVEIPPNWRIGEVAQHMPETDQGATDFVLDGDLPLLAAKQALTQAEAGHDGEAIAHAHLALEEAGLFDARSRAQALLLGLGFRISQLDASVNSFSGGWRMRLQLARALMCPAELLLLDEPTNHLDLDALVWLEAWLQRYAGTLIVISHDREFLDAVTRVTVHVEHQGLHRYGANYSGFEDMRAERMTQQQQAFAKQQERIAHLQSFIDRFKAKATKARQAQSRVKALERMERIAPVLAEAEFSFEFREPPALPNPMLSIRDGSMGYAGDQGPREILRGVTRTVMAGQRIGILGANGQGKSTLVKTIAREVSALSGKLTEGKGLRIGYFAQQELDVLRPEDTPLAHMVRLARDLGADAPEPSREQDLRNYLGSFNFSGDMVMQTVGTMSGGEKARLVLAMIVWQRPNLLLLDEPTNHLDLATREALSVALNEFEGTVMLVSHDRALLRGVCDEFWLVARGQVQPFDGDLDDYQQYLLEEARRAREAMATATAAAAPAARPSTVAAQNPQAQRRADAQLRQQLAARTKPLQREIDALERSMAALQAERQTLEQRLMGTMPSAELADCGRRLKAIADENSAAEERWLELNEQLEAIRSEAA